MAVASTVKRGTRRKKHTLLKLVLFAVLITGGIMFIKNQMNLYPPAENFPSENTDTYEIPPTPAGLGMDPENSDIIEKLYSLASEDKRIYNVIKNADNYPQPLLKLLIKNPDARDFVLDYPKHRKDKKTGKIQDSELGNGIPLFFQWDERWGYHSYGSGIIGLNGCGPTCLSMIIVGLTGNTDATPSSVADFSADNGYYVEGAGTSWDLMTIGAQNYGLVSSTVSLSEESMVSELYAGHPLIVNVGPGDFTDYGHFIVIRGYENGMFLINDPNSKKLSSEGWYYSTLEKQIKNIWSYSLP